MPNNYTVPVIRAALLASLLATLLGCSASPQAMPSATSSPAPASSAPASGTPSQSIDPDEPTAADLHQIRTLLSTRARAIEEGDRPRFLSTTDDADPAFVRTQLIFFANLSSLPVTSISYSVTDTYLPPSTVAGADPTLHPEVVEHVQLDTVTTRPIGNVVNLTFVERDGQWLVGAERVSDEYSGYDSVQARPWYGTRIASASNDEVLAVVDADGQVTAADLLGASQEALDFDRSVLQIDADAPVLIDATTNSTVYSINKTTGQEAGALTRTVWALNDEHDLTRPAGVIIRANPDNVEQLLYDRQTLRHEVVHRLLSGIDNWSPIWLTEGLAEYVSTRPDGASFTLSLVDGPALLAENPDLPIQGTFGDDPAEDYLVSQAAVTALVRAGGMGGIRDLMDTYRRLWSGSPDSVTPTALRQVYELTREQLAQNAWGVLGELLG